MNNPYSGATAGNAADAANTSAFLQQAVDHYPRLVAFSFTLVLPYRETMTEYRSLILRFHTDVWQRTGEYAWKRQQASQSSPPTILRWIWESVSAPECRMVLMMNLDTLGAGHTTLHSEINPEEMNALLRESCQAVCGAEHNGVVNLTPLVISRTGCGSFTGPFNQLKARAQEMREPVTTARTGVICT